MPQIVLQNTEAFNAVPYYTFIEGGSSPAFNMKLKEENLMHVAPHLRSKPLITEPETRITVSPDPTI